MIRFYSPDIDSNPILPLSDSQHCVKVLRMRAGDSLEITDGKGFIYTCRLVDPHPKRAMVEVVEKRECPLSWCHNVTIAVAPTKHMDRMEWLVEKLVEIGVNRIVPMKCRFSERREINIERLQKIAVSAMKQSLKSVLPVIDEMTPFKQVVEECPNSQKFIAYCADNFQKRNLSNVYVPNTDVIMLIGPEGDFSEEEAAEAVAKGYLPVTLGKNRLRTETAALYSCTAFHVIDALQAD